MRTEWTHCDKDNLSALLGVPIDKLLYLFVVRGQVRRGSLLIKELCSRKERRRVCGRFWPLLFLSL